MIDFEKQKPPINTDVLVWVADDFNCFDVGRYNPQGLQGHNGWETNCELARFRKITHWDYLPQPINLTQND